MRAGENEWYDWGGKKNKCVHLCRIAAFPREEELMSWPCETVQADGHIKVYPPMRLKGWSLHGSLVEVM